MPIYLYISFHDMCLTFDVSFSVKRYEKAESIAHER